MGPEWVRDVSVAGACGNSCSGRCTGSPAGARAGVIVVGQCGGGVAEQGVSGGDPAGGSVAGFVDDELGLAVPRDELVGRWPRQARRAACVLAGRAGSGMAKAISACHACPSRVRLPLHDWSETHRWSGYPLRTPAKPALRLVASRRMLPLAGSLGAVRDSADVATSRPVLRVSIRLAALVQPPPCTTHSADRLGGPLAGHGYASPRCSTMRCVA
jgi:hypothetical protein